MRRMYGDSEVVTLTDDGTTRASYADVCGRIDRLCRALQSLGVGEGDRVATFAWNTQRHLEAYMATPCMGAVLHTINVRLFEDQLTYIANHAEDKVVLVDDSLVPVLEKVAPAFETVQHWIVMGDGDAGSLPNALRYEELIADQEPGYDYPELDDRQAAGLCYTSGTTGNPKGVLYSHRSNLLHSFGTGLADTMALSASDRMLPVVPMFHANAWGIPYAAGLVGAGRIVPLVEARLIGDDGEEVPWDGESTGELEVRGPWVASAYYNDDSSPEKFHDGWLRTGDIAAIDDHGFIRISDRTKDVIKSG